MTIEKWETLRRVVVNETPIFRVSVVERDPPFDAEPANFYVVDLPDWVNVVALTESDEVVLVRQYRHGTDEVTLEIPGGNVDEGESMLEAAKRELLEESGYASDDWQEIGVVEPNPAIQSNRCATFLARNAKRVRDPEPDLHEDLEIDLVRRDEVDALIEAGTIGHALVVAAFFHLHQWERGREASTEP